MASKLEQWLQGGVDPLRWIEFEAYARHVFANDAADWYRDASRYAAGLMQAQGIVGTDCLSVDIVRPILDRHPKAQSAADLVAALADDGALQFLDQALSALLHRYDKRLDVLLKLSVPFDLLAGGDTEAAPEFNDLDDVAAALTALVRRYADRPLAGIVLEKTLGCVLSADENDAYEPLVRAARHYGWVTAMAMPAARDQAPAAPALDLDLLLLPELRSLARNDGTARPRTGGGLDAAFWGGAALNASDVGSRLLYGTIPATATPETVVAVLRSLQAQ